MCISNLEIALHFSCKSKYFVAGGRDLERYTTVSGIYVFLDPEESCIYGSLLPSARHTHFTEFLFQNNPIPSNKGLFAAVKGT